MLLEKNLFSLIYDIRNEKIPDLYIFFGDLQEYKYLIIDELKNSLTKVYKNQPVFYKESLSDIIRGIKILSRESLFVIPFLYWLTDCQENINFISSFAKLIKKKLKNYIIILDFYVFRWHWNQKEYLQKIQDNFINLEIHYIECFTFPIKYIPAWIINFCKLYQYNIENDAAAYIADILGNDISNIIRELKKIFLFILPNKNIDLNSVKISLSDYISISDFQFYDFLANKNKEKIIESILSYKERNYEPIVFCRGIRNEIEKMLLFMEVPNESKLSKLGISIKSFPFLKERTSKFNKDELLLALFRLDKVEKSLKENSKLGWNYLLYEIIHIFSF